MKITQATISKIFKEHKLLVLPQGIKEVSGGCINHAYHVQGENVDYFIKLNSGVNEDFFQAEANGLKVLRQSGLNVPEVLIIGKSETNEYIIQKFIRSSKPVKDYWLNMGMELAKLHGNPSDVFGLEVNNYIGSLPQINKYNANGVAFFIENRLEYQLNLAEAKDKILPIRKLFDRLYKLLPDLIDNQPATLVHGDLWSGNIMPDQKGNPLFLDPAIYYGHREADLAFTVLFGGFHNDFYNGYNEVSPLQKDYELRFKIFNLYPLLVHYNIFGAGYLDTVYHILLNLLKQPN